MNNNNIIAALILAIGLVAAVFMATNAVYKVAKNDAIGNCYQVATAESLEGGDRVINATDTVDGIEERNWEAKKAQVNEELLEQCISRKGY